MHAGAAAAELGCGCGLRQGEETGLAHERRRATKRGNGQLGRAEKRAAWEEERGVLGLAREGPEGEG